MGAALHRLSELRWREQGVCVEGVAWAGMCVCGAGRWELGIRVQSVHMEEHPCRVLHPKVHEEQVHAGLQHGESEPE